MFESLHGTLDRLSIANIEEGGDELFESLHGTLDRLSPTEKVEMSCSEPTWHVRHTIANREGGDELFESLHGTLDRLSTTEKMEMSSSRAYMAP